MDDRIWLECGSWNKIVKKGVFQHVKVDCIFGSPPWGGPQYLKQDVYDLETSLEPMGIEKLLKSFLKVSSNVILFLPKNSNLNQLAHVTRKLLGPYAKCKVLYVNENGYTKGMLCMWGDILTNYQETMSSYNSSDKQEEEKSEENKKEQKTDESITSVYYDANG